MGKAKIVEGGGLKNSMAPKEVEPEEYEVKDAVATLERAHEIQQDKRLMPHVHKHMSKKIRSLKDLRALANKASLDTDVEEKERKSIESKELSGDINADEP